MAEVSVLGGSPTRQPSPPPFSASSSRPSQLTSSFSFEGQLDDQLNKESFPRDGRKQLPDIPIPHSGRMHGAPMSPVRINVQREGLVHRPSSARIESYDEEHGDEYDPYNSQDLQEASPNLRLERSPQRETFTISNYEGKRQSHHAIVEGAEEAELPGDHLTHGVSIMGLDSHEGSPAPVARLQYHHQGSHSTDSGVRTPSANSNPRRLLTPSSLNLRNSVIQRPASTYSTLSDYRDIHRGRSPGGMPRMSSHMRDVSGGRNLESRPTSYIDLLTTPYAQQQAPTMSLDNAGLRNAVGTNASLLSTQKTLEMYRMNVKKTNDPSIQYAFALFLIQAAQEKGFQEGSVQSTNRKSSPKSKVKGEGRDSPYLEDAPSTGADLLREAKAILQRLSDRSYPFAQYYLADGYASGLFNKQKPDHDRSFPLFIAASKHGHAESGHRAAICYEYGWGTRKDPAKAVQFYRQSASKNHPGAMTRLGKACIQGELGLDRYREGLKWLKRATESADVQYNSAPYALAELYETGYGDDIFKDEAYAAQLFTQAAELGNIEASYRLGDAYEHGRLSCPKDPALSVHFYTTAAERGHALSMMALCAWYMVGAEPLLSRDENEAFEWAQRAAELGLTKAQYATGYFCESGIGCRRDMLEANLWYVRAAEAGDVRAKHRLQAIAAATSGGNPYEVASSRENAKEKKKKKAGKPLRKEALNGDYGLGPDRPVQEGKGTGIAMAGKKERDSTLMGMGNGSSGQLMEGEEVGEALIDGAGNANSGGKAGKVKEEKECVVM